MKSEHILIAIFFVAMATTEVVKMLTNQQLTDCRAKLAQEGK